MSLETLFNNLNLFNQTLAKYVNESIGDSKQGHAFIRQVSQFCCNDESLKAVIDSIERASEMLFVSSDLKSAIKKIYSSNEGQELMRAIQSDEEAKSIYSITEEEGSWVWQDHFLELKMELLAACWVVSYFSLRRNDLLWSEVRQLMGRETHGFPDGVCTAKEAGDFYRHAIKQCDLLRHVHEKKIFKMRNFRVRHLAYDPYLCMGNVLPGETAAGDVNDIFGSRDATPCFVRALGARYQMVMQIAYMRVPENLFTFVKKGDKSMEKVHEEWLRSALLWQPPKKVMADDEFGKGRVVYNKMLVWTKGESTNSMPAMVLGLRYGLYTAHVKGVMPLPFSGRPVTNELFHSFSFGLISIATGIMVDLDKKSADAGWLLEAT